VQALSPHTAFEFTSRYSFNGLDSRLKHPQPHLLRLPETLPVAQRFAIRFAAYTSQRTPCVSLTVAHCRRVRDMYPIGPSQTKHRKTLRPLSQSVSTSC